MATNRDPEFETLFRRHYARVFRFFRRYVADDAAHDLAQDTFTRIYESFEDYRDGGWSFIEKTARNVLYNRWRAAGAGKRKATTVELDDPAFSVEIAAPQQPDLAERDESARNWKRFREAIAELPAGQRQCVELQLDGMKLHEIAAHMGITMDAVKTRLKEAKKRLRKRLGDVEWLDRLPEDDQ